MNRCLSKNERLAIFEKAGGFVNLNPEDIYKILVLGNWPKGNGAIVDDKNFLITRTIFTISFYHLLNSLQYFMSYVFLGSTSPYNNQSLLLWYYSIFYSQLGFIESNLKSFINISHRWDEKEGDLVIRRKIWYIKQTIPAYSLNEVRGQQHELITTWFFNLLSTRVFRGQNPTLEQFIADDKTYFTDFRIRFNYRLDAQLDEIYYTPEHFGIRKLNTRKYLNDILNLLHKTFEDDLDNYLPEEVWAIEHLRTLRDTLLPLLKSLNAPKEIKGHVARLVEFHKYDPYKQFIYDFLKPIMDTTKMSFRNIRKEI